jgi:cysteine-rich repeat protein
MRHLLAAVLLLVSTSARADILAECEIPDAAGPKAAIICEMIRIELRIAAADWNRDTCATEFMRRGMREFARSRAVAAARQTVNGAEQDEVNQFEIDHGEGFVRTFCGDGVQQAEFGEVCDDGNGVDGDGCETDCTTTL